MHMLSSLLLLAGAAAYEWSDCDPKSDGHAPNNSTTGGPFKNDLVFLNTSWNDHMIYVIYPNVTEPKFPVMLWMHGSTGLFEMNQPPLELYASHGFIVVFPYIKGPIPDSKPFTLNTDGKYLLNALEYAGNVTLDSTSPLYNKADMDNVVVSGHSMGATCSIEASTTLARAQDKRVKLVITQHPGICGPIGPPPYPATWLPKGFADMNAQYPVLMTTATNDNAFYPPPKTASHETDCYKKTLALGTDETKTSIFVEYSEKACSNDNARLPFDDSGHDCVFKTTTETPWVTTAIKYYTHMGANPASNCHAMLFGTEATSFRNDPNVENIMINQH